MAEELILLGFWASVFGTRARIALAEKGIDYEYKEEDMRNKSPLLLMMNPLSKQIPVFIHSGKPVIESLIIVRYIDEVWKDKSAPFLPSNPYEQAHAMFWAEYIDDKIYSVAKGVWINNGEEQEMAEKKLRECFELLEEELGNKPYFGGETFGIVDISLIPFSSWFHTLETCGNLNLEAEFPQLVAWTRRCMEKESVSKSMPDAFKIYDLFMGMKKKYQVEMNSKTQ